MKHDDGEAMIRCAPTFEENQVKDGYRILDSDIHLIEPLGLWSDYIAPKFRDRIPTRAAAPVAILGVDGKSVPPSMEHPARQAQWRRRVERAATVSAAGPVLLVAATAARNPHR